MLPFFPQNSAQQAIESMVAQEKKKKNKTKQPVLCCRADGDGFQQLFLVIDKKIFLEMSKPSYVHHAGLLVNMIASLYTFNFGFEASY